jgi:hypothetical protein
MSNSRSLGSLRVKLALLGVAMVILLVAHAAMASRGTGGGRPQGRCPDGWTNCRGQCVLLSDDENNCGACALVCPAGWNCTKGACCPGSLTNCEGTCVDTSSDPSNCGGCGTGCGSNEQCVAGQCSGACAGSPTGCSEGFICCPDACSCNGGPSFLVLGTCETVDVCPEGSTPCIATTDICYGSPSHVCCPTGTTCAMDGTCHY